MPLTGDKKRAATLKAQRIFIAKEKKQLQATLDGYLDDVKIIMEWKDGKRVVTFDMAKTTNDALELVAAAQGTTLDVILRGVISKNLLEGAKLLQVKERAQRAAAREEQRAKRERHAQEDLERRAAEIAELKATVANQPARDAAEQEAMQEAFRTGQPFKFEPV